MKASKTKQHHFAIHHLKYWHDSL